MKGIWNMRRQKGFTLVELLVVIAIIGVLATLVLLQLGTARGRARDTQRITTAAQIRDAIEQYYEDNDAVYPTELQELVDANLLQRLPMDPLDGTKPYGYAVDPNTDSYQVYIELENRAQALNNDSDIDATGFATAGVNGYGDENATVKGTPGEVCTSEDNDCIYDVGVDNTQ